MLPGRVPRRHPPFVPQPSTRWRVACCNEHSATSASVQFGLHNYPFSLACSPTGLFVLRASSSSNPICFLRRSVFRPDARAQVNVQHLGRFAPPETLSFSGPLSLSTFRSFGGFRTPARTSHSVWEVSPKWSLAPGPRAVCLPELASEFLPVSVQLSGAVASFGMRS